MSIFRRTEQRSINSWPVDFAHGGTSLSADTLANAMRLAPVFAATSLIADSFSVLPVTGYTNRGGSRKRLDPQPDLCVNPHFHPLFTRVEWLHQFCTSFLLRGNSYGLITQLDSNGRPSKIAWLNPDHMRIDESGPRPVYWYNEKEVDLSTLVHIPWYPQPGSVVGLSPIGLFKSQIETGLQAGNYGHTWFKNGATPSGHLKYGAGPLTNAQSDTVKARFKAAVKGNDFFVSGNDWEWKALSVSAEESQFLQTIKATANTVASIFRVDPEEIGGESPNSLTYRTLELNQIKFQVRTLQPIFTRLEHHMNMLLPPAQYVKFNPDAVVRTELKTRMEAHEIALRIGMETNAEGRALEDKAPLTPAEMKQWKELYGDLPAAPAGGSESEEGGA